MLHPNAKLEIKEVPTASLKPSEYNPRQATNKEFEDLKQSIQTFGIVDPIIINSAPNRKGVVIGGHFRLKVCEKLGIKSVPTVEVNIPDIKKEQELNLRLNRNLGQWDWDLLANFDEKLLLNVGFDAVELGRIFQIEPQPEDDQIPQNVNSVIKYGEIYQLGEHKLMCGSAINPEDLQTLFGLKRAALLFTSPPYDNEEAYEQGQTRVDYRFLIKSLIGLGAKQLIKGGVMCINIGNRVGKNNSSLCAEAMENKGLKFLRRIIWLKPKGVGIPCHGNMRKYPWALNYTPQMITEDILMYADIKEVEELVLGSIGPRRKPINFEALDSSLAWKWYTDVWEITPVHSDKKQGHPAAFPVELAVNVISFFSLKREVVYEPCAGSGSTIIACEKTGRVCYAIEIMPKYCDVAIKRWENYTGKKAEKINGRSS